MDEISIDENQIGHRGRLSFRQYNPGKKHKCGIKMYQLVEMTGYAWNFSIYCEKGKDSLIHGLDHPGSVVVKLTENLLNAGRLLVADNWYNNIPLANCLTKRYTEYCGTIKSSRKEIPSSMKDAKLKKGDIKVQVNTNEIKILKYNDKKDVPML